MYLYEKDPYEAKYQFSINNRESTGLKYLNDSKIFIKYSICMIFIKILKNTIQIVDDMVADMDDNEKLNKIMTELFITAREFNYQNMLNSK